MASRRPSVRKAELERISSWLDARGLMPVAVDALPGGGVRVHLAGFTINAEPGASTLEERETAAWDAALP